MANARKELMQRRAASSQRLREERRKQALGIRQREACKEKKRFKSCAEAEQDMPSAQSPYLCPSCGEWHRKSNMSKAQRNMLQGSAGRRNWQDFMGVVRNGMDPDNIRRMLNCTKKLAKLGKDLEISQSQLDKHKKLLERILQSY